MSKQEKLDRKALKKPDQFTTRGRQALMWVNARKKQIIPIAVAGVLLVVGVYAFDWWSSRQLNAAWTEYYAITKDAGEDKWEKLKVFHKERDSFRPGYFAALELGDHHFEKARKEAFDGKTDAAHAEAAQAVEWYTRALDFGDLLPAERQLIYINRGNAHEVRDGLDNALTDYRMAVEFGGDPEGLALLNLGRVQGLKGEKEEAKQTYERLTKEFLNTEYAKLARNHLRRIESPLFTKKASK